jgi:hypothetical protein
VSPDRLTVFIDACSPGGQEVWVIGEVAAGEGAAGAVEIV